MDHTLEQHEDLSVTVAITLDPAEVQSAFDEVYAEWKDQVQLPGYRKGKAPRKLVESTLKKRFGEQGWTGAALEKAIGKGLRSALDEADITPYTQPHVNPAIPIDQYKEGEPFSFEVAFTRRPDIPEFDYKAVRVQIPQRELRDEDIAMSLENIRVRLGESTPIEGRPAEPDDWAHIRLRAWLPGVTTDRPPLFDNELDRHIKGEPAQLEFLDDHLIGLQVGETIETDELVPADFVQPPFPEATALHLIIDLMNLDARVLPELTDELVKEKLGVYDTIAQLTETIRQQLDSHIQGSRQEDLRAAVETKLLTEVVFALPQPAVESRYTEIRGRNLYTYKTQGRDLEAEWESNPQMKEQFETGFWELAERSARLDFIVDTVAEREGIKVTDQELSNHVYRLARESQMPDEDVEKLFRDRDFLLRNYVHLLRRKAWLFVLGEAEVEEVTVSPGPSTGAQPLMERAMEAVVEALGDEADPESKA